MDATNTKLQEFKKQVIELDLLSQMTPSEEEQNDLLDSRDAPSFDGQWVRVHQAIEHLGKNSGSDTTIINEIRESAFHKAFQSTGNTEIASYVSDDFELLSRAIAVNYSDKWLDLLWIKYQIGEFPHGNLSA